MFGDNNSAHSKTSKKVEELERELKEYKDKVNRLEKLLIQWNEYVDIIPHFMLSWYEKRCLDRLVFGDYMFCTESRY